MASGSGIPHVKILFDYSDRMYPGYPEHTRQETGAVFFYQNREFRKWFRKFIESQAIFKARQVSLATFRSAARFRAEDIELAHPPSSVKDFNVDMAFSNYRSPGADYAHLEESLDFFTKDKFTGLVWLITANRIDAKREESETAAFFKHLMNTEKYRSVHIYGLPFEDNDRGRRGKLCIYAILVSPEPLIAEIALRVEDQFHRIAEIFGHREHFPLKSPVPHPLNLNIQRNPAQKPSFLRNFHGDLLLMIPIKGAVKNNLDHFTIFGGNLSVEVSGQLSAGPAERAASGIVARKNISANSFNRLEITLTDALPPGETQELTGLNLVIGDLSSPGELSDNKSSDTVKVRFSSHSLRLSGPIMVTVAEREQLFAIFGSDSLNDISYSPAISDELSFESGDFDLNYSQGAGGVRNAALPVIFVILLTVVVFALYLLTRLLLWVMPKVIFFVKGVWNFIKRLFQRHRFKFIIAALVFIILFSIYWERILINVETGEAAVLWTRLSGTITDRVYGEGLHIIFPWNKMTVYSLRFQEHHQTVHILTDGGLNVEMDLSFRYHPARKAQLPFLHQDWGPDYAKKIVIPEVLDAAVTILGNYKVDELHSLDTIAIQDSIEDMVDKELENTYILFHDFLITRILIPTTISAAIEKKISQKQFMQEYDFKLKVEAKERERKAITSDGIRLFEAISKLPILQWRALDETSNIGRSANSKIIIVGSDGLPVISTGKK
ncbi:MAG: prohibitin family protein [bacterium]|nr:prohibitin family protein [bacterium]